MTQAITQRNQAGQYNPITRQDRSEMTISTGETSAMVLAAQAKALVAARYEIAMRQPRDLDLVRDRLLKECRRPSFAEVAIYRKPIGKGIEGPSIRFVEAALQIMGNMAIDTPAVYDDSEKRILRVSVSDMETNVAHSKDVTVHKTVERRSVQDGDTVIRSRTNKDGHTVYIRIATDDEILNTENALVSKATRTEGLRLIPGWLVDECLEEIRKTRQSRDAEDPDAAKRRLFDAFSSLGVSPSAIQEWLGRPADNLQPAEISDLRGIYQAIKDGETAWSEVMDSRWEETLARGEKNADKAAQAVQAKQERMRGTAAVKAAVAANKRPPEDDDDIQFATPEEEEKRKAAELAARVEAEKPAREREPGDDDGDDDEFAPPGGSK